MSKLLIIPLSAAVMFASAIASPAGAAEVCATAPTCAELGYTLTSTTNCVGTPLKCPFDKTKYYCTTKQEAAAAAMPDYSQRQGRSIGSTYTAATNGFLVGYDRYNGGSGYSCDFNIFINNINVKTFACQTEYTINDWTYPVKKGSTYRVTLGSKGEGGYFFVPSN